MKRHELFFSIIKIPLDFFSVIFAFLIAKQLRVSTESIFGYSITFQTIETERLLLFAYAGACLYVFVFAIHTLYNIKITHSKIEEIFSIIRYSIYWFFFYSVCVYLGNDIIYEGGEIPRLIIIYSAFLACIFSILGRLFFNLIQGLLLKKGIIQKRNLLIITQSGSKKISHIIRDIHYSGIYTIIGYVNDKKVEKQHLQYLGNKNTIFQLLQEKICDEILYINSDFSEKTLYKIWEMTKIMGIRYRYITNNFDVTKSNTILGLIYKTPVIEIQNTPIENWNRIGKRFFDIFFSLCIMCLLSPIFIIIAILIKLDDKKAPVIYKNLRIGQNGQAFTCYKFRYMHWKDSIKEGYGTKTDEDPAYLFEKKLIEKNNTRYGPLYKIRNDPRKTKIGAILERYSLDELPQFYNVFIGDMSIVGPRPHQPREVEKYDIYQKRLLTIKPGITGMAQVNGRERNTFQKEAELDLFYIENWSFLLDIKIIIKTIHIEGRKIFSNK